MENKYDYVVLLKKAIKKTEEDIKQLQENLIQLKEELREKEGYQALEEMEVEY